MRWLCLLGATLFLMVAPTPSAHGQTINVLVDSSAEDGVGRRLAAAVRERFAGSPLFNLIYDEKRAALRINLVTLDPDKDETRTIYSAVITLHVDQESFDYYVTSYVGICGVSRVGSCADRIEAEVDTYADSIKKALSASE